MRDGWLHNTALQSAVAQGRARLYVEAIASKGEDIRRRRDEWEAGILTNVEAFDDGALRLAAADSAIIAHTSGTDWVTDLDQAAPFDVLAWTVDANLGKYPVLRKIELYLTRKRDAGASTFDGWFAVQVYAVRRAGGNLLEVSAMGSPVHVLAGNMASDTALAAFTYGVAGPFGAVPEPIPIDKQFNATVLTLGLIGRTLLIRVWAGGGSNTNYGWGRDSASAIVTPGGSVGRLHHLLVSTFGSGPGQANMWAASSGTGMVRATITLASYPASGTAVFDGSAGSTKVGTNAAAVGELEFEVLKEEPPGTAVAVEAKVAGGDPWVVVKDGQSPADVGLAVPNPVLYYWRTTLTSDASHASTPTLRSTGLRDRIRKDFRHVAEIDGYDESVDPTSGQVKMAAPRCFAIKHGLEDFRDLATRLLSENNLTDIEFRAFIGAEHLTRDQWMRRGLWRVRDQAGEQAGYAIELVSILERLKGRIPPAAGTLYGYILKQTTSDLTGGADFTKEISEGTETAGTLAPSIAASTTETQRMFTPAGVPGLARWMAGSFTVLVNVTVANSNIKLRVRVSRANSAGAIQESSNWTDQQTLGTTGVKTFTTAPKDWAAGAAGDRVLVELEEQNTDAGGAHAVTFETGTTNTQVAGPWIPTTTLPIVTYSGATIAAAYTDVRDGQLGLAERYRGAAPSTTARKVARAIQDQDARRLLEQLAFLDGGCVIDHQGLVQYANLYGPRDRVVAVFPDARVGWRRVSPGFKQRLPLYRCSYGFGSTTEGGDRFSGEVEVKNSAAFAAFGLDTITNPDARVDDEVARWIPDQSLAYEVARDIVLASGHGMMLWDFTSIDEHPELEIGDAIACQTKLLAVKNPITGAAISGYIWAVGVIVGLGDIRGTEFTVWIRSPADLFVTSGTVYRRDAWEPAQITLLDKSQEDQPGNARVALSVWPLASSVKVYYHAAGAAVPEPTSPLWIAYTLGTILTLARDQSAVKYLSTFATLNGLIGPRRSFPIQPDHTATINALSADQGGAVPNATVTAHITPDPDVRRARYYMRKDSTNWPTTGSHGPTDPLDESYFVAEKAVTPDGGGFDAAGGTIAGGPTQLHTGTVYNTGDKCKIIVVPLDSRGNSGPRKTLDYTVSSTTPAALTAFAATQTAAGSSCGAPAQATVVWTPNAGVANGTHNLLLYRALNGNPRQLVKTETSPATTTSYVDDLDDYEYAAGPAYSYAYSYELVLDAEAPTYTTIVASGSASPPVALNVTGLCPV